MTSERAACLGALCVQISTTIHDATRRQAWAGVDVNLRGKKDVENIIHTQFVPVMWHVQNFTLV